FHIIRVGKSGANGADGDFSYHAIVAIDDVCLEPGTSHFIRGCIPGQIDLPAACYCGGQAGWRQRRNEVSSLSKAGTGGREESSHESEEPDAHCVLPFRVTFLRCFLW